MHFYYLDESGCTGTELLDSQQPIFVLGGVSIRDEGWNATQEALRERITAYFGGTIPDEFELHAEELLSPNGDGPFKGHDRDRRSAFAKSILRLIAEKKHNLHLIGLDKQKMANTQCNACVPYDVRTPYLLAYDYMITYINWFVKEKLGQSARAMIILDTKDQFMDDIERITFNRRFEGPTTYRANKIVEFSYPIDSRKNPMVQLSDLVVFCAKKFLECEGRYRPAWPANARRFYAECYSLIDQRIAKKNPIKRETKLVPDISDYLEAVRAKPVGRWKRRYGL
ncbi:MAG: DUF3800 domain-containing protein [Deinococcus sp.]|nr:DUF3800 domain-containing protein [Deinococcus sp.]